MPRHIYDIEMINTITTRVYYGLIVPVDLLILNLNVRQIIVFGLYIDMMPVVFHLYEYERVDG